MSGRVSMDVLLIGGVEEGRENIVSFYFFSFMASPLEIIHITPLMRLIFKSEIMNLSCFGTYIYDWNFL